MSDSSRNIIISVNGLNTALLLPDHPDIFDIISSAKLVEVTRDSYGLICKKVRVQGGPPKFEIVESHNLDETSSELP